MTSVPEAILGVKGDTRVVHHAGIRLSSTPLAVTGHPLVTPYKLRAQLIMCDTDCFNGEEQISYSKMKPYVDMNVMNMVTATDKIFE